MGDTEWVLRRSVPAEGRSRSHVNGELATAATLAELGATLLELHGQHAQQSLLAPRAQRACSRSLRRDRPLGVRRCPTSGGQPRRPLPESRRRRARAGAGARPAAGSSWMRSTPSPPMPGEDEALASEEDQLSAAVEHRERGAAAGWRCSATTAPRKTCWHGASPRSAMRLPSTRSGAGWSTSAPSWTTARRSSAGWPTRSNRTTNASPRCAPGGIGWCSCGGSTARPSTRCSRTARRWLDGRASSPTTTRCAACAEPSWTRPERAAREQRGARCRPAGHPHRGSRQRSRATWRLWRCRAPAWRSRSRDTAEFTRARAKRSSSAWPPTPPPLRQPLARVASGGELSRVMLALRLVLSEGPPTMVFDEVDAGIGGEAAVAVGSGARQARPAATGPRRDPPGPGRSVRRHPGAGREVPRGRGGDRPPPRCSTTTRVVELSRMLSGSPDSEPARRHAEELLDAAARPRPDDADPARGRRPRRRSSAGDLGRACSRCSRVRCSNGGTTAASRLPTARRSGDPARERSCPSRR